MNFTLFAFENLDVYMFRTLIGPHRAWHAHSANIRKIKTQSMKREIENAPRLISGMYKDTCVCLEKFCSLFFRSNYY